eukprot:2250988-Heterocapsa_arctica.AAC.1
MITDINNRRVIPQPAEAMPPIAPMMREQTEVEHLMQTEDHSCAPQTFERSSGILAITIILYRRMLISLNTT